MTALSSLDLSQTQVVNLAPLAGLNTLRSLNLSGNKQLVDENVLALAPLVQLQDLDLSGTGVKGDQKTKLALPFANLATRRSISVNTP